MLAIGSLLWPEQKKAESIVISAAGVRWLGEPMYYWDGKGKPVCDVSQPERRL